MTIMNDKTREFVAMHRDEDVRELALKAKRVDGLDLPLALGGVFAWLLVSGLHALRGKSLQQRTLIYGAIMLVVIIAIVVVCNMGNPFRVNPLLGMFF